MPEFSGTVFSKKEQVLIYICGLLLIMSGMNLLADKFL